MIMRLVKEFFAIVVLQLLRQVYRLLCSIRLSGQDIYIYAQSIPDPEFSENPYILGKDNTLKSLEKAEAQLDVKVKIIGGNDTYYTV